MKMLNMRALACASVVFAAVNARAQEAETENAGEEAAAEEMAVKKPAQEKFFHLLPFCRLLDGVGEVKRPGAAQWEALEEGRFYPLGCSYRTVGAQTRLTIQFGRESEVLIAGEASFGTLPQTLDVKSRTLMLETGTIEVHLPRNLPEGLFVVTAPGFTVVNPAGEARYTYTKTGDGDEVVVRCVTGALSLKGRHFEIPSMRAANEVKIRSSNDFLFTGLYGTSGDYIVKLDQGLIEMVDPVSGEKKLTEKPLEWRLSPQTAVRIHRAKPALGERMSVTTMTFDETGALRNRCAFAEGLSSVNTGEQGVVAQEAKDDLAKKAAEAAETVEAEEPAEKTEDAATDAE
jgi:hypothetical protein